MQFGWSSHWILFYVASDSSPLYKIWKQSDYYLWRYCILKIWGIWVPFGCERSCSSPRRVSNFNSNIPQGGIYPDYRSISSPRTAGQLVAKIEKSNWSTRRQMSSHWNCTICVFGNKSLMPGVLCDMLVFRMWMWISNDHSLQLTISWLQLAMITVVQGWSR